MSTALLAFGPPKGVRNTNEPYDDAGLGDFCQDARNCYFRDPTLLSGAQARPGFNQHTPTVAGTFHGIHSHTALNGTIYNFIVNGNKIWRLDSTFTSATDVTPGTITLTGSDHVSIVSVGDVMVVTDGVNRPWQASNLGATPIVGANIDINAAGDAWSAFGPPSIYQDSVAFITLTVPGGSAVTARIGIVWSEPNQPTVGYTQTNYANFANLIEQGTDPLTGILGTNVGFFYWRETSVGMLSGPLFSFKTTPTADSRAFDVGTITPWSIAQFGSNIFFNDQFGRAQMMPLDGNPQAIWKQMSGVISAVPTIAAQPAQMATWAQGVIIPELDLYATVIYGVASGGGTTAPIIFDVFDGATGNYCGRWDVSVAMVGTVAIEALGVLKDSTGATVFVVAGNSGGFAFLMDLSHLSTGQWRDGSGLVAPTRFVMTNRLGYAASKIYNADLATLILMSADTLTVTVSTPYTSGTVEATAMTPNSSSDSTYRAVIGIDVGAARGFEVKAQAVTAAAQWGFQRVEMPCVVSKAGPEDQ